MTLNIPNSRYKRIVVVGGGFGGLALVKKLSKLKYQTVLVDRNNYHQFQPLLYQVATSGLNPGDIAFPLRKVLRGKKNVWFRRADVEGVDAKGHTLHTSMGDLKYDYLVLATGSTTNYFGLKNIEPHAMPMKQLSDSLEIRDRILSHLECAAVTEDPAQRQALLNIVIVGGGPSGVELAGAFAEMKRYIMPEDYPEIGGRSIHIYLIEGTGRLLGTMSEKTSEEALHLLRKMGVKVLLKTMVTDYRDGQIIYKAGDKEGEGIPSQNLIWTSGVKVDMPAGLEAGERPVAGRILTDDLLAVKGYEDIYAIGDASVQQSGEYPKGYPQLARIAIEQADHLAANFKRMLEGKPATPFVYTVYPVMATVGRNHAYAEFRRFRMRGFFAWLAWVFVHLITVLGVKNKLSVLTGWFWNYLTFDHPIRIIMERCGKAPARPCPKGQPEPD